MASKEPASDASETLVSSLARRWGQSWTTGMDASGVGLALSDSSLDKSPRAGHWLRDVASFCLAPALDGERRPPPDPAADEAFEEADVDVEAPDPNPLHYTGLGRAWSPRREAVFSARLAVARSRGAVLVLLRHGESEWNAEDRFTGWADVGVTDAGRKQAVGAGHRLAASGLRHFDDLHSSALRRTVDTLGLTVRALNGRELPSGPRGTVSRAEMPKTHPRDGARLPEPMTMCRSFQLNERHYGALTGVEKAAARAEHGADRVHQWRRGWHATPPPMGPDHPCYAAIDAAYQAAGGFPGELPAAESLAACESRVVRYLQNVIKPQLSAGRSVLVAAHNNVIRTIIHHLDSRPRADGGEDPDLVAQLACLDIPYATPLVYTFERQGVKLQPFADEMQRGVIRGTFLT